MLISTTKKIKKLATKFSSKNYTFSLLILGHKKFNDLHINYLVTNVIFC